MTVSCGARKSKGRGVARMHSSVGFARAALASRNFSELGKKRIEGKMSGFETLIEQALKDSSHGSGRTLRNYPLMIPRLDWVAGNACGHDESKVDCREISTKICIVSLGKREGIS